MAVEVFAIRHGQTDDNAAGVFQGQGGRGLSELGRLQADRVAERIHRVAAGAGALVYLANPWVPADLLACVLKAVGGEMKRCLRASDLPAIFPGYDATFRGVVRHRAGAPPIKTEGAPLYLPRVGR